MKTAGGFWPEHAISVAFQTDKPLGEYARLGSMAEALGFDGVSVYDDLGYQPSTIALTVLAEHTRRVRLGAACANPFLVHPFVLASAFAALHAASGGRAYFGIARGAWLDQAGVAPQRPLRGVREAIEIVRSLVAGGDAGYAGEVFRLAPGARLAGLTKPDSLHVLLGAWGPLGSRLAASHADECKIGGTANPDLVRVVRSRLAEATTARPAASTAATQAATQIGLAAGSVTVVDHDRAAARALARREVVSYIDVVGALDPTGTLPDDLLPALRARLAVGALDDAARLVPDDVLDRFCFAGRPVDVAARAIELFGAGATRIEFGTPHGLTADLGLALLGREVLPIIKETTRP